MNIRRLFSLRFFLIGLGFLVLAIAGLYFLEGYRGRKAWETALSEFTADGRSFDTLSLLPDRIDEEKNFFALPSFQGVGDEIDPAGERHRQRIEKIWDALKHFSRRSSAQGTAWLGRRASLPEEPVPGQSLASFGSEEEAGRAMLEWIDQVSAPEMNQWLGGVDRPRGQLLPTAGELAQDRGLASLMEMHSRILVRLAKIHAWRTLAAARADESEAALESLRIMLRCADAGYNNGYLLGILIGNACELMAIQASWEFLASRTLRDDQLAILEAELAHLEKEHDLLRSLWVELRFSCEMIGQLREGNLPLSVWSPAPSIMEILPRGLFDHNRAALLRWAQEFIFQPFQEGSFPAFWNARGKFELRIRESQTYYFGRFPNLHEVAPTALLPAFRMTLSKTAKSKAYSHQARSACALERYYLVHQTYPEALSELVPAFIGELPHDPATGQPMHYRRAGDRYEMWSIGPNLVDDGGRLTFRPDRDRIDDSRGDWLWTYDPQENDERD